MFEGEDFYSYYKIYDRGCKDLVISFQQRLGNDGLFLNQRGFGENFLGKRKINSIFYTFIVDSELYKQSLNKIIYASSMGGAGAVRAMEFFEYSKAILISPVFSVHPEVAPFESRWREDVSLIETFSPWHPCNLKLNNQGRGEVFMVYDPFSVDAKHVSLFDKEEAHFHLKLPFSGHPSSVFINEIGALSSLLNELVSGGELSFEFLDVVKKIERERCFSHAFCVNYYRYCLRKN